MSYVEETADVLSVLEWIESRLKEELLLEEAAQRVSLSKYHFHRLFHAHVGMPLASYIRHRRLANAAGELIVTDRRILDIAIDYVFDSQASFTRAFKRVYQMSPGQYRKFFGQFMDRMDRPNEEDDLMNMMNQYQQANDPKGWILAGSNPGEYEMGVDLVTVHHGRASGRLQSRTDKPDGFATMMQTFKATHYRGNRYELSAFIQIEEVNNWCGLWMRVDGKDEEVLQFDNMARRPLVGSTSWSKVSVVLDVPAQSENIAIGVLLMGKGKVWVDSIRFEAVSLDVPTTNMEETIEIPEHPLNLDFEEIQYTS